MIHSIKQDVRDKWADALESGTYEQARGTLRNDDPDGEFEVGFCCLGVLCEVAIAERVENFRWNGDLQRYEVFEDGDEWYPAGMGSLHPVVITWAGLDHDRCGDVALYFADSDCIASAVEANDSLGKSFADIAAAVRALPVTL